MKTFNLLLTFLLLSVTSAFAAEGWTTDYEAAFKKAKKEKKVVLLEFTGSDWCLPCIEMRKDVFSKKEFLEGASKDFVLVEIDLPSGNKALKKKNIPYVQKHKVEVFPTIILLDGDKKEFHRFKAKDYPTTKKFLAHLKASLKKKLD